MLAVSYLWGKFKKNEMDAKELMIGNILQITFLGNVQVKIIGFPFWNESQYIQSESKSGTTFFEKPDKYKPIPLTEEWIKENTINQKYCDADLITVDVDMYDPIIIIEGEYLIGYNTESDFWEFLKETTEPSDQSTFLMAISAPIKYIHTFQNYFPAFSGTELKIKP